jgi:hypothetical protein
MEDELGAQLNLKVVYSHASGTKDVFMSYKQVYGLVIASVQKCKPDATVHNIDKALQMYFKNKKQELE